MWGTSGVMEMDRVGDRKRRMERGEGRIEDKRKEVGGRRDGKEIRGCIKEGKEGTEEKDRKETNGGEREEETEEGGREGRG